MDMFSCYFDRVNLTCRVGKNDVVVVDGSTKEFEALVRSVSLFDEWLVIKGELWICMKFFFSI